MKKRNIGLFLGVACIFTAIGAYTSLKKHELLSVQSTAVANLFATSLPDINKKTQPLSQWKGKTLLVNFWATWCAPCVKEMPELSELQLEAAKKNIQIIGIGIDSAANITEFALKYQFSYPLYIADTNAIDIARQFGNASDGLPFTVLIDDKGQVKKSYLGRLKLEELKQDLQM